MPASRARAFHVLRMPCRRSEYDLRPGLPSTPPLPRCTRLRPRTTKQGGSPTEPPGHSALNLSFKSQGMRKGPCGTYPGEGQARALGRSPWHPQPGAMTEGGQPSGPSGPCPGHHDHFNSQARQKQVCPPQNFQTVGCCGEVQSPALHCAISSKVTSSSTAPAGAASVLGVCGTSNVFHRRFHPFGTSSLAVPFTLRAMGWGQTLRRVAFVLVPWRSS